MARISQEARDRYSNHVRQYELQVEALLKREKGVLASISRDPTGAAYKRFALADQRLNVASIYLILNRISVSMLRVKNQNYIREALRCLYQSLMFVEEVVSNIVDAPFSEYAERLQEIASMPDKQRFGLIRKLGFSIQYVNDEVDMKSRWKSSFVDLEGRLATAAKNVVNLRSIVGNLDPRVEGYELRVAHVRLTKELLSRAADRHLERQIQSNSTRVDDFQKAINFLLALRRLHMVLGEPDQAETVKKKADVWKSRMDDLEQKLERDRPGS
jgi:hypothetical protein